MIKTYADPQLLPLESQEERLVSRGPLLIQSQPSLQIFTAASPPRLNSKPDFQKHRPPIQIREISADHPRYNRLVRQQETKSGAFLGLQQPRRLNPFFGFSHRPEAGRGDLGSLKGSLERAAPWAGHGFGGRGARGVLRTVGTSTQKFHKQGAGATDPLFSSSSSPSVLFWTLRVIFPC